MGGGLGGAGWSVVGAAIEMPRPVNITGAVVILGVTVWHVVKTKLEARRQVRDDREANG
jgi:hypothetical protein